MGRKSKTDTPLGVDEKSTTAGDAGHAEKLDRVHYHRLKSPEDVLSYVQWAINSLHKRDLALEADYLGKVIYLLNTWLNAYKVNLENVEVKQIREEIAELKRQMEVRRDGPIIVENR